MNKKLVIITGIIITLVLLFFMFNGKKAKYITKPVTLETITETVEASGTIKLCSSCI